MQIDHRRVELWMRARIMNIKIMNRLYLHFYKVRKTLKVYQ